MANSNLVLHRGAKEVSLDDLRGYQAPPPEGRWFPISHGRVLDVVSQSLGEAGYVIERQRLGVMRDGSRFFGTLDLKSPVAEGINLAVGIRNSVDKTFPLGFCAGSRVFVCDNLAFSSELLVRRKHTIFGERDFARRIVEAVGSLPSFQEQEALRIERMRGAELDGDQADALISAASSGASCRPENSPGSCSSGATRPSRSSGRARRGPCSTPSPRP